MNEPALLENFLFVGAILFAVGLIGFLSRRNMIVMFLSAEMMLQGVAVNLVAFSRFHNDWGGQVLVIMVVAVAACEAAIAMALVMMAYRRSGSLDITFWQFVREEGTPPLVDRQVPESLPPPAEFPHLTPAGAGPAVSEEEQETERRQLERTHVS